MALHTYRIGDTVIINSPLKATKVIIVAFCGGASLTTEQADFVFVSEIANPFNQIRLHISLIRKEEKKSDSQLDYISEV